MEWAKRIIPKLPKDTYGRGCVVYFDNARIHGLEKDTAVPFPELNAKKDAMCDWLKTEKPEWVEELLKKYGAKNLQDLRLIREIKPFVMEKRRKGDGLFAFDEMLKQQGHVAIRTPPYTPEYQVMEFIFGFMKQRILQLEGELAHAGDHHVNTTWTEKRLLTKKVVGDVGTRSKMCVNFRDHCARLQQHHYMSMNLAEVEAVMNVFEDSHAKAMMNIGSDDEDDESADDESSETHSIQKFVQRLNVRRKLNCSIEVEDSENDENDDDEGDMHYDEDGDMDMFVEC